jgi:hypothetical protein
MSSSMRTLLPRPFAAVLALGMALAGCGKSLPAEDQGRGAAVTTVAGSGQLAVSGLATKNTTRLGGADPVADAAAVALATNPGLTPATRPQAVALVNRDDWPVALAAAALASHPLGAPLLFGDASSLPTVSGQALATMRPSGTQLLGGAQVIEIGSSAALPGYRVRSLAASSTGGAGAGRDLMDGDLYTEIEQLVEIAHGGPPGQVIVIGADGPPALAMPAAGLAAETGAPIMPVNATGVPPATRAVLARLHRPTIYVVGPPAAVSHRAFDELARLGPVRRIDARTGGESGAGTSATSRAPTSGESAGATANAIGVARFSDGSFGWGIDQPGHGLVFANASRPLDAAAAAPLSASGQYGPLLLLEGPDRVPPALAEYLSDIQPGYGETPEYQPVHGVYNHGWLIGDEQAIAASTQAELDALLEISPRGPSNSTTASPTLSPPQPTTAPPSTTASATTSPAP